MEIILNRLLRLKILKLLRKYSFGLNELVIDIPLSIGDFETIEYDDITLEIFLHRFYDDFDDSIEFEDLNIDDKLRIYQILNGI